MAYTEIPKTYNIVFIQKQQVCAVLLNSHKDSFSHEGENTKSIHPNTRQAREFTNSTYFCSWSGHYFSFCKLAYLCLHLPQMPCTCLLMTIFGRNKDVIMNRK